ncbi:MAG: SAM-dependent methyltransferase [Reichenbachiella sp.]
MQESNTDITDFIQQLSQSLSEQTFVKMSFGKPTQKDSTVRKVSVRIIEVKGQRVLCFSSETQTQNTTKNYPFDIGISEATALIGTHFKNINLFTTKKDYIVMFSKKMVPRLQKKPATFLHVTEQSHNREKRRYISTENNIYLQELKILTPQGAIAHSRQNKFKQIDKFVEVIDSLIQASPLKDNDSIAIADMGSGKGYLTFALYDYLKNSLKINPTVTGIEYRNELVLLCNTIAQKAQFNDLSFVSGSIAENTIESTDVLIALHACDTATDDAIKQGIESEASIIVTAPCCHKQIRKDMNVEGPLSEITRHGILKERQAEMVTDTIRALLLEAHGYKTQVFEFIADAHTHKNVMITAVKRSKPINPEPYIERISSLKEMFGIAKHYLETIV